MHSSFNPLAVVPSQLGQTIVEGYECLIVVTNSMMCTISCNENYNILCIMLNFHIFVTFVCSLILMLIICLFYFRACASIRKTSDGW